MKQKETSCYLGGWAVFDADSFYNKIAERNNVLKKPYLVIRNSMTTVKDRYVPKKSFSNFDEALDYCEEESENKMEHNLHAYQDQITVIKDQNQFIELVLKAQEYEAKA